MDARAQNRLVVAVLQHAAVRRVGNGKHVGRQGITLLAFVAAVGGDMMMREVRKSEKGVCVCVCVCVRERDSVIV
jgi:hypothetical protein